MTIISLSGKKQSGKSTVASLIRDILKGYDSDCDVHIMSWADSLKEEVAKACGVSLDYLEEHKANFRLILQGWGTDFRRELCHKCYWIERLLIKLAHEVDRDAVVIIPDTRFLNELETLKELGATILLVKRDKQWDGNKLVDLSFQEDSHRSETELDKFTGYSSVIENYYSLGNLKQTLVSELQKLNLIKL